MMKKLQKLFSAAVAISAVLLTSGVAMAEGAVGAPSSDRGLLAIAVAIGIGIAALGGTLSQGRTASAALEGIARNPNASDKVFVPMILGLAFIESLVLFTWVLMLLMQLKM